MQYIPVTMPYNIYSFQNRAFNPKIHDVQSIGKSGLKITHSVNGCDSFVGHTRHHIELFRIGFDQHLRPANSH